MHACEHVAVRAVVAVAWCLMRCALSDSRCGCVCRRSPHRFELVLQDPQVIGMRRTAQVLMGRALQLLGDGRDVKAALKSALGALKREHSDEIIGSLLAKIAVGLLTLGDVSSALLYHMRLKRSSVCNVCRSLKRTN